MVLIFAFYLFFSIILKILLDDSIDDFLRKNGYKALAKKREWWKNITHHDIKKFIPQGYIICNYSIYGTLIFMIFLMIASFFVSPQVRLIMKNIGLFIILLESFVLAIIRIFEVLFHRYEKSWRKFLLVCVVVFVLVFLLL